MSEGPGGRVLLLFANPLSAKVLRVHADGPIRPSALYREVGWDAQTTVRSCVGSLRVVGALVKHRIGGSPHAVENELTPAGEEMLLVAETLEAWLARAPEGPLAPDGNAAKVAVKALAGGWSSTMVQALAAGPRSLAELDATIAGASYPSLKRGLSAMRLTHLVEPAEATEGGSDRSFAATRWLRHSVAPLSVAARCERRHMVETTRLVGMAEIETALLLAAPLALVPADADGSCCLGIEARGGGPATAGAKPAGVTVGVAAGEVVSCAAGLEEDCSSRVLGAPRAWLDALIDGKAGACLRASVPGGRLATELVDGVHLALFGA